MASNLLPYQTLFVDHVRNVIERNFALPRPSIRLLDAGCDPSGAQLAEIAELTRGQAVGINLVPGFPGEEAEACRRANPRLMFQRMDATHLEFEAESFDLVVSANVMEHVHDPATYIRECARVLRPGGVAYFETYPVWTGARGHHMHEEMVERAAGSGSGYRNDGSFIPDWGHLTLDEPEMRQRLADRLPERAVDFILRYLYHDQDLNRWGWRQIEASLRDSFLAVDLETFPDADTADGSSPPADGADDYGVSGFRASAWKTPASRSSKLAVAASHALRRRLRLIWKYQVRRLPGFAKPVASGEHPASGRR